MVESLLRGGIYICATLRVGSSDSLGFRTLEIVELRVLAVLTLKAGTISALTFWYPSEQPARNFQRFLQKKPEIKGAYHEHSKLKTLSSLVKQ